MKAKEIRDKYKNEMGVSYKDNDSKIRLGYIYWLENKVEEYSQLQTREDEECSCGNPIHDDYAPCCGLHCWHLKFDAIPPNNQISGIIRVYEGEIIGIKTTEYPIECQADVLSSINWRKRVIQDLKQIKP